MDADTISFRVDNSAFAGFEPRIGRATIIADGHIERVVGGRPLVTGNDIADAVRGVWAVGRMEGFSEVRIARRELRRQHGKSSVESPLLSNSFHFGKHVSVIHVGDPPRLQPCESFFEGCAVERDVHRRIIHCDGRHLALPGVR